MTRQNRTLGGSSTSTWPGLSSKTARSARKALRAAEKTLMSSTMKTRNLKACRLQAQTFADQAQGP
ncbi:MAG: hypothetical protein C9356_13140 [Oleiphilus sp.]|nr:MAG: hypothetical protein C9356_13140 [Oleiphilus sp.]